MNDHNNIPDRATDGPDEYRDEYRDGELAAHLNADRVPQHGPDFWSDLQTKLDAEAATAAPGLNGAHRPTASILDPAADATTRMAIVDAVPTDSVTGSVAGSMSEPVGEPASEMVNVVPLQGRRPRTRMPMLLSAAAAVLLLAVGAVALLSRNNEATSIQSADQDELGETQDPDVVEPQPDSSVEENGSQAPSAEDDAPAASEQDGASDEDLPELPVDYFSSFDVTIVAEGSFVGFSPDDSSVLVLSDVTTGETGCEGAPLLELSSQSLATGERVAALPEGVTVETGGLDLKLATANAAGGTVYITEYCDGVRSATWEAAMAANGTVGELVAIEAEGLSDPFTTSGLPTAEGVGALSLSPDLQFGAFVDDQQLTVRPLDDSRDEWIAPEVIIPTSVAWDPTGQVLATTSADGAWLWNFRTGESAPVPVPSSGNYWSVAFDRSGMQLALTGPSDRTFQQISIVTFDDAPIPVQHIPSEVPRPTCSGDIDLVPLDPAELIATGVSEPVAEKVAEVDRAAASCDWETFGQLIAPDFTASFGGGGAVQLWQEAEQRDGVMDTLRIVLRQPFAVEQLELTSHHVWPSAFARQSCADYTEEDRQSLRNLGYSDENITTDCEIFDGYAGYRAGFDEDGSWLYFVAGD